MSQSPNRKVTLPLIAGIVLLPGIFVWFLLREGHSTASRLVGFGWAGFISLIFFAVVSADPASRTANTERMAEIDGQRGQPQDEGEMQAADAGYGGGDFEVEAVSFCRMMVQKNLVSSGSFKTLGHWQFTHFGPIGTVRQEYSATNAFGARVDARYRCKYDAEAQAIIALEIYGPFGKQVIVSQDVPSLEQLSPEEKAIRQERMREGAARAAAVVDAKQPTGSRPVEWITNYLMDGCPSASDWFAMQDAVRRNDFSVDLPQQCFKIEPGTIVVTPGKGDRETITHNNHDYEKGELEDGRVFWTDAMSKSSLTPR